MKVTVVIPSLAGVTQEYLKVCVESLRATTDWDIIVVTNGTPTSPDLSSIDGITKHLHTSDQGQCVATNIGAQAAAPDTDFIFISNDDMYYAPKWKENLNFDNKVFSPNLVEPTNNNGSAEPFLKADGGFTLEEFQQTLIDHFIATKIAEREHETTGFNFPVFFRKDVWDTIGGYDEAYDPWGSNSDTDLQTKVELAGIQPTRLRDVLVYHFSNKSGTFDGTHNEFWQFNWDYYTQKWGFNRDDEPKPDTWAATNLVNKDKNIYHPVWEGKYGS